MAVGIGSRPMPWKAPGKVNKGGWFESITATLLTADVLYACGGHLGGISGFLRVSRPLLLII